MIRNSFTSRRGALLGAFLLIAIATTLLPGAHLEAQEIWAAVNGTVTDTQGSIMPGVTVTVANIDTNQSVESITDAGGDFRVSKLLPGRYRITAAIPGFKTYVRSGIALRTAETATISIPLAVGGVEEVITVTGGLTEVETNQSTLAQTMENRRVAELPLNGRQVYMLLQQTAGTLFTQTQFGSSGFSGTRAWDVNGSVSIHGSRTGNNEFLIDGAANGGTGGWSYAPPVDAIEEFKVQTASTDASYGHTSGGVVNLRLRSGTNEWRGSATGFFRGTALDSNTIQNITNGISNAGHKYFDAEGMLSGPIQKDKTWFMVGYQGFYEEIPFPTATTLPTDLQRVGDFSQTFNSAGRLITIYDPLTTHLDPTTNRLVRDPFPGNRIPANRLNPIAVALMGKIPRANATGDITGLNNFINSPNLGHYRYNSYLTRIDHAFSPSHKISLSNSGNWGSERRSENSLPPGPALRSDNWPTQRKNYLVTLDDVLTLNSSTVLNTRVSFNRFDEPHPKDFGPLGDLTLPFQTRYQVTDVPWYPHVVAPGPYPNFFGQPSRLTRNDVYSVQSSLSRAMGKHFLKAGAEWRYTKLTRNDKNDENGRFEFNGDATRRDPQQGDGSGQWIADFLLGYPFGNSYVDITAASVRQYGSYGLFVQDEWKLDAKATLNLGLRWDYSVPVTEQDDKQVVGFDRTTPSPLQPGGINPVTGQPLQPLGGLLYAGVNGNSRAPYKGDWTNFAPRANFSYKFSEKVIGRASYGRSYFSSSGGCCGQFIQNGFSQRTTLVATVQTGIPFNTLARPFPDGFVQPFGSALGLATGIGTSIQFSNPNFKIPYTDQWMAGISVELPWDVGLDVAYVGNHVSNLPTNNGTDIDAIPRSEREKAIARLGGNTQYLNAQLPNPFAGRVPGTGLNNPTTSRQQLLRPYPQFTQVNMRLDNTGWSRYNGLELVVNKRFSQGLTARVNYTLSRQYEATDYLNNGFEDQPFRDLASIDRTHHLTASLLYELPFHGNRFVEGWQINFLYEWASGVPVTMPNGILRQDSAKLLNSQQTLDLWFDNSTQSNPRPDGSWAWDTLAPNEFRVAPFRMKDVRENAIENAAISVFKNTRLSTNKMLQLRFELFNPFNTRYYGGPNTTITSSQFGKITPNQFNFPRTGQLGVRFLF
jgi:outer membrane receptor protein involved in Fe transport